jgi:D-alanyl-D-alanine-carboxypeptidase/D-alanyl-D-alanine-endopeptidase
MTPNSRFCLFATMMMPVMMIAMAIGNAQTPAPSPIPSDSEIRGILSQRVDEFHQSVGIVVGMISPDGRKVVSYGALENGAPRPLDGDTVFEIGSVTKVFTSLLLSDMVRQGQVALTDPVSRYLPATVKVPQRNGKQITLQDLATHTSGLPRLPGNLKPKDLANPYADYSVAALYEFLSSYELTRDIGSQYEYSNLGGGLLGHVLALRAGMDYEALVRSRITGPLDMKSTAIALSPEMKARLAVGHDNKMRPVANWDLPTLAGAGALRSTTNDMLTFVAANLGYIKTPLTPAMGAMLDVRRPSGRPGLEIALAWHILSTPPATTIVWHNGGTGGYRSFIGYAPQTRLGVVVLANAETMAGVDDIGLHLLNPKAPLLNAAAFLPAKERKQVPVDPKLFDNYTGRYQLAPNFVLAITREGEHLYAQATGQPKLELFAEGEKEYFIKVVDAQITVEADGGGNVNQLVLHQAGQNMPAKRIK